ncbi:MAG: DUF1127 domain-containing protein [Pseudomonadota bacterium]|jgi:uncharacterized protein YjiS (DUF1127 family)|nr:DUF1127 domain-containing protein [Pseudomonadota bacterium]MEC8795875.1 DUF1127 domain-containing protein [Pseudomonadota bacterium]
MAFASDIRRIEANIAAPFYAAYASLKVALARRAVYKRTVAELNMLNDRELNDLGLHRSMIKGLAREEAAKIN